MLERIRVFAERAVPIIIAGWLFLPSMAMADDTDLFGLVVLNEAHYSGSRRSHSRVVPIVDYHSGWFFTSTVRGVPEVGTTWKITSSLSGGVQVTLEPERDVADRRPDLNGAKNVGPSPGVGLFIRWKDFVGPSPVDLLLRSRHRLGDSDGALVDARLSAGVYRNSFLGVMMHTQLTFANSTAVNHDFNLRDSSTLEAGPHEFRIGISAQVDLVDRWKATIRVEERKLQGDAKHSPVSEVGSSTSATLGLCYVF